jgi:hypothetical protein
MTPPAYVLRQGQVGRRTPAQTSVVELPHLMYLFATDGDVPPPYDFQIWVRHEMGQRRPAGAARPVAAQSLQVEDYRGLHTVMHIGGLCP